jgi:esterase/lipase superfamily enzyme
MRFVIMFGVLALPLSVGHTQALLDLPEPCQAETPPDLPTLQKRRQSLETEIAAKKLSLGVKDSEKLPETDARVQALRKVQENLLQVLLSIECQDIKQRLETEEAKTRYPAKQVDRAVQVTTYYATNRNLVGGADPATLYGSKSEPKFHYGRAIVSIPLKHDPGSIEEPSFWRFERRADPKRHFVLKSVVPLAVHAARKELGDKLAASRSQAILVFVHGYNVSFRESALRTAQLAHDLKFPGLPFFYSWPSASRLFAYMKDTETAQLAEAVFERLLDDLSQLPTSDIYIIAHSMGNRIVSQAIRTRVEQGKGVKHLRELLLAAPDISVDLFRTVIAPGLAAMQGTRTTVYASSSDFALRVSGIFHGSGRLGETIGGVFVYPGLETIDASGVSLVTRAFGHSYIMDSPSLLKDIRALIEKGAAAGQRGLVPAGEPPNTYWKLR